MIDINQDRGIWTLTLNRPDKANSLTKAMLQDLETALSQAAQADARAVVLTGTGKVFSAGADLDEARAGLTTDGIWERVSQRLADLSCLTVAKLNGTLAGGAFGMALACDLRASVPGAKFFYPVAKLGFLPQPSDPGRLAALVGASRAKLLLMTAAKIEAREALHWGLLDLVADADALDAAVNAWTDLAADAKPGVLTSIKSMLRDVA